MYSLHVFKFYSSSAVMIDAKRGILLTNSHCIESMSSQIRAKLRDTLYHATVIAKAVDQDTIDVCLLQI